MRVLPIIGTFKILGKIQNSLDFLKNLVNFLCSTCLRLPSDECLAIIRICHTHVLKFIIFSIQYCELSPLICEGLNIQSMKELIV